MKSMLQSNHFLQAYLFCNQYISSIPIRTFHYNCSFLVKKIIKTIFKVCIIIYMKSICNKYLGIQKCIHVDIMYKIYSFKNISMKRHGIDIF